VRQLLNEETLKTDMERIAFDDNTVEVSFHSRVRYWAA